MRYLRLSIDYPEFRLLLALRPDMIGPEGRFKGGRRMDRTCPKCGFVNQGASDGPMEACPKCGIIYSKVRLPETPAQPVASGQIQPTPSHPVTQTAQEHSACPQVPAQAASEKSGPVIGGWICFGIGVAVMCWSLWLFLIYGPLFLASFIMAIVAIAQKRVAHGIVMLLASVLVPLVLSVGLFVQRSAELSKVLAEKTGPISTSTPNAPRLPTAARPSPAPITASLIAKGHRDKDFSGSNYIKEGITFTVRFQNAGDSPIRAFDGVLVFTDLLDNELMSLKVSISDPIAANSNMDWNGVMEVNQFSSDHERLKNQDIGDLKMGFRARKVLFADGSTQSF